MCSEIHILTLIFVEEWGPEAVKSYQKKTNNEGDTKLFHKAASQNY